MHHEPRKARDERQEAAVPGLPSRRTFVQGGAAAAGALLAPSLARSLAPAAEDKRPNLIFIYMEGQRSDALSLAGNSIVRTPVQDRIGREGVWFRNAFCTNALCAPARASVLTGMYSQSTGAIDNKEPDQPLPADIPIFTDLLHEHGYEVAMLGKAHVKNGVRERYWDYYFGFNAPATDYYSPSFAEGRKGKINPEKRYKGYADDIVTDRALDWLKEKREKPFCLLLWYQTPHAPFYRPRRHLDLYNGTPIQKPATFDDDLKGYPGKPRAFAAVGNRIGTTVDNNAARSLEELVKDYYAGLVAIDDNIGRVVDWLETTKQLDDTAILHSSDHGYFLGEWRLYDKRLMHEPSVRVPMMLRYPKAVKAGSVRDEMVLDLDVAPTILELAGIKAPSTMQGNSFLKIANGEGLAEWRKDWLYEYYEYPGPGDARPHRGVRTERYKLIHYYLEPQEFEMYDLQADPGELHNLHGDRQHADVQEALTARLKEMLLQLKSSNRITPSSAATVAPRQSFRDLGQQV